NPCVHCPCPSAGQVAFMRKWGARGAGSMRRRVAPCAWRWNCCRPSPQFHHLPRRRAARKGDGFMLKGIAIAPAVVAAAVWLWNTSWLAPKPHGAPRLIAHRGVHQTYNREGLTNETCTAERIHPPEHGLIENTLPSMQAAFAAGADIVELDVHPTTDGR